VSEDTTFDANAYRDASLQGWKEAAPGWVRGQQVMRAFAAPVSHWMLDAVAPQPGQRVLELAAGLGETGLLAAELVAPVGGVVISDQADAMLTGARERAGELGLANVEFQTINAEWIDLPVASVDVVLCRWGFMLMADPAAALGEARRVLRPGGRIALAVWDAIERNPWAALPAKELAERAPTAPPGPGTPGPFALGDIERLRELLAQAGFEEIRVERLDLHWSYRRFEDFWETMLDLSRSLHDAILERPQPEIEQIKASLEARFAPHRAADGSLAIPARTLVASAGA
jgi:SAM-dependent methyltransferase